MAFTNDPYNPNTNFPLYSQPSWRQAAEGWKEGSPYGLYPSGFGTLNRDTYSLNNFTLPYYWRAPIELQNLVSREAQGRIDQPLRGDAVEGASRGLLGMVNRGVPREARASSQMGLLGATLGARRDLALNELVRRQQGAQLLSGMGLLGGRTLQTWMEADARRRMSDLQTERQKRQVRQNALGSIPIVGPIIAAGLS